MTTTHSVTTLAGDLRAAMAGDVHAPGDPGYDVARSAWNLAVDQRPAAVAVPADAADVQAVVRFAARRGLRVAPQGTGHGAAALDGLADSILLRTSALREVRIDPGERRARVGGGVRWEEVVPRAAEHGLAALHGSSPSVGVVGYSLGGGIGWLARRYGMASNSVIAVEMVTADGHLVRADADTEPDLFWAVRGGGANFGIVTALEFRLYPVRSVYAGWLIWPWERSAEVLGAWSAWTATVPDEVTSIGRVLQLPPIPEVPEPLRGRDIVVVEIAYLGDEAAGAELIAPLTALVPEMSTMATIPAAELARLHHDPEDPAPGVGDGLLLDALPPQAVAAFLQSTGPGSGSPFLSAEIRHLGGALGRVPDGAGAMARIDAGFGVFAIGIPFGDDERTLIERQLATLRAGMAPWGRDRDYLNFRERATDPRRVFGDAAHDRLQRVRARFDVSTLVLANHRIAPRPAA